MDCPTVLRNRPDADSVAGGHDRGRDLSVSAKYQVESYIFDQASNILEDFGFDVIQVGTHTLTIAADQDTFEDIFKTSLAKKTHEVEGMYFENTKPFIIPEELSILVAGVDIETPIDYFP